MTDQFNREYAYYKVQLAERQKDDDAFNDDFGFPRVDLAHAKAMERAQRRTWPKSDVMVRQWHEEAARARYARAIGV